MMRQSHQMEAEETDSVLFLEGRCESTSHGLISLLVWICSAATRDVGNFKQGFATSTKRQLYQW